GRGFSSHGAGVPGRRVQNRHWSKSAQQAQLDHWCCVIAVYAAAFIHWIYAAVGSTGLLGHHGGHEHLIVSAAGWREDAVLPARRTHDRSKHADSLLCAALFLPADGRVAALFVSHVARA